MLHLGMENIQNLLNKLETFIDNNESLNNSISTVNVSWHIEHSLLVITQIAKAVTNSDPNEYEYKFNFKKIWIFSLGRFPRGKAKAPNSVIPTTTISKSDYPALFENARIALAKLKAAKANQYFVHPIFGKLNVKGTFTMLTIHTAHHIKIIEDIIKG